MNKTQSIRPAQAKNVLKPKIVEISEEQGVSLHSFKKQRLKWKNKPRKNSVQPKHLVDSDLPEGESNFRKTKQEI